VAAPDAEEGDLLLVEDLERGFADVESLGHARAALAVATAAPAKDVFSVPDPSNLS
jgi:hypothetical protein